MEYLKVQKDPITRKQNHQHKVNVSKKKQLSNSNGEVIMDMFRVLGLKLNMDMRVVDYKNMEVGMAVKTGEVIQLEQKEEYRLVIEKAITMENNNAEQLVSKKRNLPLVKQKVKDRFEHSIASVGNIDNLLGVLEPHKFYYDSAKDDILFPLHGTFFTNDKIKFLNDIRQKLMEYLKQRDQEDDSSQESCDVSEKKSGFHPLIHQDVVKMYLNATTPYRGLLLFHGLGSGKTCTSVGIMEAMKYKKPRVYIMCPASLIKNYKTQMKFCGNDIFRRDEYWRFVELPEEEYQEEFFKQVTALTGLSRSYVRKKGGVYLKHRSETNEGRMNEKDLDQQIDLMIDAKFKFISYNGITMARWKTDYSSGDKNPFDHSTIVIDEGHNFVSRVLNKLNQKKTSVSTLIYDKIISAEHCNVVVLSGTPLINYPCELGVMFNMIHGSNTLIEIQCSHKQEKQMNVKAFKQTIQPEIPLIDFVDFKRDRVSPKSGILKVLKNPYGFIKKGDGIQQDMEKGGVSYEELKQSLIERLKGAGYIVNAAKSTLRHVKPFPDTEQDFNALFLSPQSEKDSDVYFKKKILGLVSYIGDKKSLMPKMVIPEEKQNPEKAIYEKEEMFVEEVMMNANVLQGYAAARTMEQEQEKRFKQSKKGDSGDRQTSSYKIFSRAACNFIFPNSVPRPYLGGKDSNNIPKKALTEDDLDILTTKEKLNMSDGKYDTSDVVESTDMKMKAAKEKYRQEVKSVLQEFHQNPHLYFESMISPLYKHNHFTDLGTKLDRSHSATNQLDMYSPKYLRILQNLMNENHVGLHLLYSQFRTLEGIGIFRIILNYYGYTEFRIKKENDVARMTYKLDIRNPYYKHKSFMENPDNKEDDYITSLKGRKFYALYTGKEDAEEKEMIRNIYNGHLDKLPVSLKKDVVKYFYEDDEDSIPDAPNAMGELIQLLMITSSGAEGIDLKNVRYVHIMEPYWHPVRLEQVIGRARRICSHKDLPEELQTVQVFLYLLVHDPRLLKEFDDSYRQMIETDTDTRNGNNYVPTTDEKLYLISYKKRQTMKRFLEALMVTSVDCMVNYDDKSKCFRLPKSKKGRERLVEVDLKEDKTKTVKTKGKTSMSNTIEVME